jgi:hypothetical protein
MSDASWDDEIGDGEQLVLSDLINRVLDKGVMINSHITISIADIDLIQLDLKLLISSVAALQRHGRVEEGEARADLPVRTDSRP